MPARRERIPVSHHHRGLPHGFEAASGQKVRQAAVLGGDVDAHRSRSPSGDPIIELEESL
jgi:hypothetical protein